METKVVVETDESTGIQSFKLEPKTKEELDVEKYLDSIDLDRLEWQRLQDDLYPGIAKDQDDD